MPYKHAVECKAHRRSLRLKAIGRLGGACQRCGYGDERALHIARKRPALRGRNGMSRDNTAAHRAVTKGSTSFTLLCANCASIKLKEEDGLARISANVSNRAAPP